MAIVVVFFLIKAYIGVNLGCVSAAFSVARGDESL